MKCPFCSAPDTKVIDSRGLPESDSIRRRRKCESCGKRFTTFERIEFTLPMVVKRDGRRESFSRQKLRDGVEKACQKRPVSTTQIDRMIQNVERHLFDLGEKEAPSQTIGNWVMLYLRHLDPVAYVRFASVYRSFHDIDQFVADLKKHDNLPLGRSDEGQKSSKTPIQ